MRMVIIVPTRGRPEIAKRLYDEILRTSDADVVFRIDNDDPRYDDYISAGLPLRVGPRKRLVGSLNEVAEEFAFPDEFDDNRYDIIGFLGDDTIPRTYRWDQIIMDNYQKNMVSYANDGHQKQGLPTGVFLDTRIIRVLGYMVPPTFIHLIADNYWKTLGEALGTLQYFQDVDIEHLHPYAGKAAHDKTYEEANSGGVWVNDELAFHNYVENQLAKDVERLTK
jgi:hypothetical protein